ncbi:hypothetical protein ACIA48_04690 [Mycobacterium sp. NPDC051804]|uniref:hypothetical protein n=1 Tax=Mycobacterium sp. NPDC051804 TaxID=3364295 RepID=UPI0037A95191
MVFAILSFAAYAFTIADTLGDALAGSRVVVLLVLPILIGVIASGYRQAPRGVSDTESDWIVAIIAGIVGFTGIYLLRNRMPTLAVQWQMDLWGVLLWIACLVAVMFGVRHVVRMWQLWLFALCCVSPLPFLLTAAAVGGSDTAVALLTAALGATAVFLAGRCASLGRRLSATMVCLVSASTLVLLVENHLSLAATVLLVAGIVPVVVTAVMLLRDAHLMSNASSAWSDMPHRSPLAMLMLILLAVMLLLINPPHARSQYASPVAADWEQRAGLIEAAHFPFITRYVGADATFVRYGVPAKRGMPAAAVDVITTHRLPALADFDDAIWYPSSRPIEYQSAEGHSMPAGARIIHSNADATTDAADANWYAVTWMWKTGDAYQRVTVIVNQALSSDAQPPVPAALSFLDTSIRPALWLARQQPDGAGQVDPLVVAGADAVVKLLVNASETASRVPTGE